VIQRSLDIEMEFPNRKGKAEINHDAIIKKTHDYLVSGNFEFMNSETTVPYWISTSKEGSPYSHTFKIDIEIAKCKCPQFQLNGQACKHLHALVMPLHSRRSFLNEPQIHHDIRFTFT